MDHHVIEFTPPAEGLDGVFPFNTFRIGKVWASRLKDGDVVYLMDKTKMLIFGRAVVGSIFIGKLRELAEKHAVFNHNQIDNPDVEGAPARLIANMQKRYGPHIAHDNKLTTVIYLRRIHEESPDHPA
ncbi:hypothetical protein [Burkholderia vietnamiensis]|uniref:hypothetical protein n=1 Tax=Burkholderia vietnamiensis TaxID=60552 RepID=UPI001CAEA0BF|nr:hypothetical protein [Burkholderia vietnamiensis]CAG9229129.1 conserved hypothetical protein [Burkholderia vietnamiensis]